MTLEALTGNPTIRWGDKSYNSIVFSDGSFASNCDVSLHTERTFRKYVTHFEIQHHQAQLGV